MRALPSMNSCSATESCAPARGAPSAAATRMLSATSFGRTSLDTTAMIVERGHGRHASVAGDARCGTIHRILADDPEQETMPRVGPVPTPRATPEGVPRPGDVIAEKYRVEHVLGHRRDGDRARGAARAARRDVRHQVPSSEGGCGSGDRRALHARGACRGAPQERARRPRLRRRSRRRGRARSWSSSSSRAWTSRS